MDYRMEMIHEYYNDMRLAEKIADMLRGCRLSGPAYDRIKMNLDAACDRHYIQERKEYIQNMQYRELKESFRTFEFRKNQCEKITIKPEKNDFITEEEMQI